MKFSILSSTVWQRLLKITKNLLTVCIDSAISEKEEDDDIENASDEEMTVNMEALLKMHWAVKMVRQLEMKMQ